MASWMIHFRVAQALMDAGALGGEPDAIITAAFAMGNIAPDSGVPDPSGQGYTPNKDTSHVMRAFESGLRDRCDTEGFAAAYLAPSADGNIPDPEAIAFYLGYLSHLATDNAWLSRIVIPAKERFAHLRTEGGQETPASVARFYAFLKKDWYDMDFLYLKHHADLPVYAAFLSAPPFENRYLPYFARDAFEARRAGIADFYRQGVAQVVERETYLSEEELSAFVSDVAQKILSDFGHLFAALRAADEPLPV